MPKTPPRSPRSSTATPSELTPQQALDCMVAAHELFYLESKQDELIAMYWLWRRNGDMVPIILAQMPTDQDQKKALVRQVRKQVDKIGDVYLYAFLSEGWTLPPMTAEEYRQLKLRPSESEQRIEVINTYVAHRDGRKLLDIRELVRDWQSGRVVELKPIAGGPYDRPIAHVFDLFGD